MPISTPQKKREGRARIKPPTLDEMEAMIRHPEFQRSLSLWRAIFKKNYKGLTEEEDLERDAPRTAIRVAAIIEADRQWLSRSIVKIRQEGEDTWAFEAVNGPLGDRSDTVTIPTGTLIPGDLSPSAMGSLLARIIRQARNKAGIVPIQRTRASKDVDRWQVYDLRQEGRSLLSITRRLFKVAGKPNHDKVTSRRYKQVRDAYRSACAMIQATG